MCKYEPPALLQAMQWCILCGKQLNAVDDRRYKQLGLLASLLQDRCHSTPYVFRFVNQQLDASCLGSLILEPWMLMWNPGCLYINLHNRRMIFYFAPPNIRYLQDQKQSSGCVRCPCCIACINWIRRLNIPYYLRRRKARRVPIPMDNLLLFLQCPGAAIVRPDQRSFVRLIKNLCSQEINPLSRFLTPLMNRALQSITVAKGRKCNKFLVDQLVLAWWENSGRPVILPDRITARYVRRSLRHSRNE
jgi:hypothetical protein